MKNKFLDVHLLNILIIIFSSIILRLLLNVIKVSGKTNYDMFFIELLVSTASYLIGYFLLAYFLQLKGKIISIGSVILISFLGSVLFAICDFGWGLYIDWDYISKNSNDLQRHIKDSVFATFILIFTFSFICSIIMEITYAIISSRKKKNYWSLK